MSFYFVIKMLIRKGHLDDLMEIQQLFVDTIENICKTDHNSEQIKAGNSAAENNKRWIEILTKQFLIVA
jgi:putative acetyltransferase